MMLVLPVAVVWLLAKLQEWFYLYSQRTDPDQPLPSLFAAADEEPPEAGSAGEAGRPRGEKDARNLTVDFTKLDMATLKRYKRHYRLKTRQNVTKTELSLAVAKHFASQTVDEADIISLFMYSARYALASQNNRSRQTIDMV